MVNRHEFLSPIPNTVPKTQVDVQINQGSLKVQLGISLGGDQNNTSQPVRTPRKNEVSPWQLELLSLEPAAEVRDVDNTVLSDDLEGFFAGAEISLAEFETLHAANRVYAIHYNSLDMRTRGPLVIIQFIPLSGENIHEVETNEIVQEINGEEKIVASTSYIDTNGLRHPLVQMEARGEVAEAIYRSWTTKQTPKQLPKYGKVVARAAAPEKPVDASTSNNLDINDLDAESLTLDAFKQLVKDGCRIKLVRIEADEPADYLSITLSFTASDRELLDSSQVAPNKLAKGDKSSSLTKNLKPKVAVVKISGEIAREIRNYCLDMQLFSEEEILVASSNN